MKLSIITPSYNQGNFIRDTFESVLNQDIDFKLEYILVDAVSTDNTPEIVAEFIPKFKEKNIEFVYICEKDGGQPEAVNKGLRKATGEIVAFINSDDKYEPGAFARIMQFFRDNPEKRWVSGKCKIINESNHEIRKLVTLYKNILLKNYSYSKLLTENFISQPATFWRKELHNEIGFLDESEHYCLDYEFWLRIGKKYPAGILPDYLASFRYYPSSKTGEVNPKQYRDALRLAKKFGKDHPFSLFLHTINCQKIIFFYKIFALLRY